MAIRWSTRSWALALLAIGAHATATDFRILHAESIDVRAENLAPSGGLRATSASLSFQAYGRQFDLELEPNERLLSRLPATQRAALQRFPLFRGQIEGSPDSWVRLARVGEALHGMMWDGAELYVIEPARAVERFMVAPVHGGPASTTVYRLSDTQSNLGAKFCTVLTPGEEPTPLDAYQSLVGELKQSAALAAVLTGEMQVALLGDSDFAADHPLDAQGVALVRMNSVDGIFSDQVGVRLTVSTVTIFDGATDPFTSTTGAEDLIDELSAYKSNAANGISSSGVAHLMTGRDLDGTTVGIAFLSSICSPSFGVSLSMGGGGLEISEMNAILVAAHEFGHNFGAPHDAETGTACESTPPDFLMAAQLNGSSTFSQCSLDEMQPEIAAAACITPLAFSDGELSAAPSAISAQVEQTASFAVTVSSVGSLQIDGVVVTITIPAAITVTSAVPTAGTCSSGAGAVTCDLGSVPGGSSQRIDLTVQGTQAGTFVAAATLAASNDADAQNNSADVSLSVTTPPSPPSSGGGGGGALGGFLLLGLVIALARRAARVT